MTVPDKNITDAINAAKQQDGRLAGIDVNSYKVGKFTDVNTSGYYAPSGTATRAECSAMFRRFIGSL